MSDACKSCRFFIKQYKDHTFGDCHRHPPQFNFSANMWMPNEYGSNTKVKIEVSRFQNGVWPNVSENEWCGEYQEMSHD